MTGGAALSSPWRTEPLLAVILTLSISAAQSTATVEGLESIAPVRPAPTTDLLGELPVSTPGSLSVAGSGQTDAVGQSSLSLTVSPVNVTGPQR